MSRKRRPTADALEILYRRYYEGRPDRIAALDHALLTGSIAEQIFGLRIAAGLSQSALAKRLGTTASVICRLEDNDYRGHSVSMLKRIADALGAKVDIRFLPAARRAGHALPRRKKKDAA